MTLSLPTNRYLAHSHYLHSRALWQDPEWPDDGVQKTFEEALHGYMKEHSWRCTHMSESAIIAVVDDWNGRAKLINRGHGILPGTMGRNDRAKLLLGGPELPLDVWWEKFVALDVTAIITRDEHNNQTPLSPLIPLPPGLFMNGGKSAKIALFREGVWLSEQYKRITGLPSPIAGRLTKAKACPPPEGA